jgi:CRISPR/Cas system-associated endoribonuclease Cas2
MARLIVVSYDISDDWRRLRLANEDSVRLCHFCLECDEKQEIYGQGRSTEEPEVYIL